MKLLYKRVFGTVLLIAVAMSPTSSVSAAPTLNGLVSPVPAASTPHALGDDVDNKVLDIAQAGKYMFYGGNFTQAANPQKTATLSCGNLIVQDLTSGATACPIRFDGEVEALYTYPGGQFVFAGGQFSHVTAGGVTYARKNVVKIAVSTLKVDPSFDAHVVGHEVSDIQAVGANIILAGDFKTVGGTNRAALASVAYTTGALTNYLTVGIAGTTASNAGSTQVYRMAINPAKNRAMIIGNFTSVGGRTHYRAASLLLGTANATVSNWDAPVLRNACSSKFPSYLRDVDFSPDGKEFVMGATGGKMQYPLLCDTVSMWPVSDSPSAQPRWIDYTPADTIHSVVHTGTVVYAGGHQKGHNVMLYVNGVKQNTPRVTVSGIGALNAATGRAYKWPAGRDRGEGAKKLLVVQADAYHGAGLYVGSDTEWWYNASGARTYNRERIAFLPLL